MASVMGAPLVLRAQPAHAAFVGGVERFDGTIRDLVTWQPYVGDADEVISQNNALFITDTQGAGNSNSGDYTTRTLGLRAGSTVSAKVTLQANGIASLYLTTNSTGTTESTPQDSFWASIDFLAPSGFVDCSIGGNGGSGPLSNLTQISNPIGQALTLQIQRPNARDFTFRVFNAQGTQLGTNTIIGTDSHPEGLFVSLAGVNGSTAMWDDVTVTGNLTPEPTAVYALALVLPLLRRRTR